MGLDVELPGTLVFFLPSRYNTPMKYSLRTVVFFAVFYAVTCVVVYFAFLWLEQLNQAS